MLQKRTLVHKSSTVGPSWDPYHRDIWMLCEAHSDGSRKEVVLTQCALAGNQLTVNGHVIVDFTGYPLDRSQPDAAEEFVQLTGLSHRAFCRAQDRVLREEDDAYEYERLIFGGK